MKSILKRETKKQFYENIFIQPKTNKPEFHEKNHILPDF